MAKPKTPRFFTTLPSAVIGDDSLTALDIRCLAVIALHDGMSGFKGTGAGCYAKNITLARLARTDATNFSKSLTKLIRAGYVVREPQLYDKRRFTLRVVYPDDNSWRPDQQMGGEIVGDAANDQSEIVGEGTIYPPKVVGEADSRNGSFSRQTDRHYISLNEEIDFVETSKINSAKRRDVHFEDFADDGFTDQTEAQSGDVDGAWQGGVEAGFLSPSDPAYQALSRGEQCKANLARYERMLQTNPRQLGGLPEMAQHLYNLSEEVDDTQVRQWAYRLYEKTWEVHGELQQRGKGGAKWKDRW